MVDRKTVCFYVGYTRFANDMYGSELALVNIAKRMTSKYNVVIVGFETRDSIQGVNYMNIALYKTYQEVHQIDVLIVSRYINCFLEFENLAKRTYIWIHDNVLHPYWNGHPLPDNGKYYIKNLDHSIDGYICLTEWHKESIRSYYGLDPNKIIIIGNGVTDALASLPQDIPKVSNRFIYVSDPKRCLIKLLEYFHTIKEQIPDAELYIYRGEHEFDTPELKQLLKEIEDSPYLFYKGVLDNSLLLLELAKADVWFFPTNVTETYCTSALEAMYCGCLCVTSKLASLQHVIADRGILIDHPIYSDQYRSSCIESIVDTLRDPKKKQGYQDKGREWAKGRTWDKVYLEWVELVDRE